MPKLTALVLLSFLFFPRSTGAQNANPLPTLIATCKPSVVAIALPRTEKMAEETQLPVVLETTTKSGEPAYVYIEGTGFIVSADGYIVTAEHVIHDLPRPLLVVLSDGKFSSASVITTSTEHDFALLKAELKNASFLQFGKFTDVVEGDDVLYIGHPFGQAQEVASKGMISVVGDGPWGNTFQLDAIVNSGNSGGPMIDVRTGRVLGMVKAKYGKLSPYLKSIADGTVKMNGTVGGAGFDLAHFVKDVATMMDLHIQMGIGYAVSTEYVEKELNKAKEEAKK